MTRVLIIAAIFLAVVLMLVALTQGGSSPTRIDDAATSIPARIAMLAMSLLLVGGGAVAAFRTEGWKALRYIAVWVGVFGVIALLYLLLYPGGSA